jgi:hypothetical protein
VGKRGGVAVFDGGGEAGEFAGSHG